MTAMTIFTTHILILSEFYSALLRRRFFFTTAATFFVFILIVKIPIVIVHIGTAITKQFGAEFLDKFKRDNR